MDKTKLFFGSKVFKVLKWTFLILLLAYALLVTIRVFHFFKLDKINAQVEKIHSTRLTMADVTGENLPPDPGETADDTVAGVDVNNNGIRDDVEIAIFEKYPDSPKTRAALLQYALALQMEFTQPFVDTTIATEVVREQSRGFQCIGKILEGTEKEGSLEDLSLLINFVKARQFNTTQREKERGNFLKKVRSYSDLEMDCDGDSLLLMN